MVQSLGSIASRLPVLQKNVLSKIAADRLCAEARDLDALIRAFRGNREIRPVVFDEAMTLIAASSTSGTSDRSGYAISAKDTVQIQFPTALMILMIQVI